MNLNKPNVGRKQMKRKDVLSLDHIDPTWEEGRDYQFVCGWDCKQNWREMTVGNNSRKSNRFLPWRYCADEIGQKPCETGDWVQFLVGFDIENDIPGEWVLMEFEGPEWFEATRQHCAEHHGGVKTSSDVEWHRKGGSVSGQNHAERGTGFCNAAARANAQQAQKEMGTGFYDPEVQRGGGLASYQQKKGLHAPGVVTFETCQKGGLKGGRSTASQKWRCLKTGHVSNAGALTSYQRHRNIDTSLRERIE
jgi:hypothetical protein